MLLDTKNALNHSTLLNLANERNLRCTILRWGTSNAIHMKYEYFFFVIRAQTEVGNLQPDSPSEELNTLIKQWLEWDCRSSNSYATIQNLVAEKNWTELENVMSKRLKFGTAGIRGRMGYG